MEAPLAHVARSVLSRRHRAFRELSPIRTRPAGMADQAAASWWEIYSAEMRRAISAGSHGPAAIMRFDLRARQIADGLAPEPAEYDELRADDRRDTAMITGVVANKPEGIAEAGLIAMLQGAAHSNSLVLDTDRTRDLIARLAKTEIEYAGTSAAVLARPGRLRRGRNIQMTGATARCLHDGLPETFWS